MTCYGSNGSLFGRAFSVIRKSKSKAGPPAPAGTSTADRPVAYPTEGASDVVCSVDRPCRRIGRRARKHADQRIIVEFVVKTSEKPRQQQRNDRDYSSVSDPDISARDERRHEILAGTQPHARKEKRNAHFAQHQVGRHRRIGDEPVMRTVAAESGWRRSADRRQGPVSRAAERRESRTKYCPSTTPSAMPMKIGIRLGWLRRLSGVCRRAARHGLPKVRAPTTVTTVAQLQLQIPCSHQVDTRTVDACNGDAARGADAQFGECLAVQLGFGDKYSA